MNVSRSFLREDARRRALLMLGSVALGACTGVPIRTMAKLAVAGPDEILGADAQTLRVALDVDMRVKPVDGRAPVLDVALVADSGMKRTWSIPLEADPVPGVAQGLRAPRAGRHWLVWRLPDAGVQDFREMQALLKPMLAKDEIGSLLLKVRQDWIGDGWPALRQDRIATWVRTRASDGYYELWTGRVGEAMGRG